jgi:ATP-dependent Clp endopeptidase proteolytic subunit ClpP
MIEINIHKDIANEKEGIFLSMFGLDSGVFSVETVKNIFEENAEEQDFKFNIHCDGGSVSEGLAIYDILRNSGKNIYTNIEGSCHSMAVTLLLAAPKENRTANRNARALIHQVYGGMTDYATADQLREYATEIDMEQNAILDIYAERTGYNRTELEKLMKAEKVRTAQELLEYGFISQINTYNTNFKTKKMTEIKEQNSKIDKVLEILNKVLPKKNQSEVNIEFKDAEGNVVFKTEKEDGSIAVGDTVEGSDGTFIIEDGREVTIEGGVVTAINERDETQDKINALETELAELKNTLQEKEEAINSLTQAVTESTELINELRATTSSKVEIQNRKSIPEIKKSEINPNEEVINQAKESYKKFKGVK